MKNFDDLIIYVDDILKIKEYKTFFNNEAQILNSFIMNNHRLFHMNAKGRLCIKKSVLDKALKPERHLKDITGRKHRG